jgi:uncharacterized protein (TIGR02265 family)
MATLPPKQPAKPKRMMDQSHLEALIKSHQADQDPVLLKEIKEVTGYDHYHAKKEYPQKVFIQIVEFFIKKFYAHLSLEEAAATIAYLYVRAFVEDTILGRVTFALRGRTTHPKLLQRFLDVLGRNTLGEHSLEIIGPKQARMVYNDDVSAPIWVQPLLEAVLQINNAVNPRVTYTIIAKNHIVYDLSWDA